MPLISKSKLNTIILVLFIYTYIYTNIKFQYNFLSKLFYSATLLLIKHSIAKNLDIYFKI